MSWQDDLDHAFGIVDREFAVHPSDKAKAKEVIKAAKAQGASFDDFQKEVLWNCYQHVTAPNALQPHVARQLKKARALW